MADEDKFAIPEDEHLSIDDQYDEETQDTINNLIGSLFDGIDLPGDKERIKEADQILSGEVDSDLDKIDAGDDGLEGVDPLGPDKFYPAADPVHYDRPDLPTDKGRRITVGDLDNLFEDLKTVEAGGKPSTDEPTFGQEIEPEKMVADLPELQEQRRAQEQFQADKIKPIIEEPKSAAAITDDTAEPTPSLEDDFEIPDLTSEEDTKIPEDAIMDEPTDLPSEEDDFQLPEFDLDKDLSDEEKTPDDDFSLPDIDLEPDEKKAAAADKEEDAPIPTLENDMELPDIDLEPELKGEEPAIPTLEEEMDFPEIDLEPEAEKAESDVIDKTEEPSIPSSEEDDFDLPDISFDGLDTSDTEEKAEEPAIPDEEPLDLPDIDLGDADDGTPDIMKAEVSDDTLGDVDEKLPEEPIDITEKSFDDIAAPDEPTELSPEFEDMDSFVEEHEKTIEEEPPKLKVEEEPRKTEPKAAAIEEVESEFDNLVPLDKEAEITETEKNTLDELETIDLPTEIESQFDSIPEMEAIEPRPSKTVAKSIDDFEDIAQTVDTIDEAKKFEEPVLEEPALADDLFPDEPSGDSLDLPEAEDFTLPEEKPSMQEDITPQPSYADIPQPIAEAPVSQEMPVEEGPLDFTDSELELIQRNIQTLPQTLGEITTDVIVNEKLPKSDLKFLTDKLIHDPNVSDIKNFLEERLGYTINIKERKREQAPAKSSNNKPVIYGLIAASILFLIGGAYLLISSSIEEKKKKDNTIELVKNKDYTTSTKPITDIGSNDINWLHRLAEAYIKNGDEQALKKAESTLNKADAIDTMKKETRLLQAKLHMQQAEIAAYEDNYPKMDELFNKALDKFKDKAVKESIDESILDQKAKMFIRWGDLLKRNNNIEDAGKSYKQAAANYVKLSSLDDDSPLRFYGMLRIQLRQKKLLEEQQNSKNQDKKLEKSLETYNRQIDQTYNRIKEEEFNIKNQGEEALTEYAGFLYENNKRNDAINILTDIAEDGKPFPKAYYQLGKIYQNKPVDLEESLENYEKGLLAYYREIHQEKFEQTFKKITIKKTDLQKLVKDSIIAVENDKKPQHMQLQAKIFNNIGENLLKKANELSFNDNDKAEKQNFIDLAIQNFYRANLKDPKYYRPYTNLAYLTYHELVNNPEEYVKQKAANNPDVDGTVKDFLEAQFKQPKQLYLDALNRIINDGNPIDREEFQDNLDNQLVKAVKNKKTDAKLIYNLGFIYYQEKNYKRAAEIWEAIKRPTSNKKFDPNLNFALGNAYLKERQDGMAKTAYENVIEFYKNTSKKYIKHPDHNSKSQKEVFSKLAQTHNNLGIAYDIRRDQDPSFREKAILHFAKALEYATILNPQAQPAESYLVLRSLIEKHKKIIDSKVHPSKRYFYYNKELKYRLDPIKHMVIEDIDPYLKN